MKNLKILFVLLCCFCSSIINAQTTYKNVTIDRDRDNNTYIVVRNDNSCSADIRMQYKIGSKDAEWREFTSWENRLEFTQNPTNTIPANTTVRFMVFSKIYALKLTYVHLNIGEVIKECIDAMHKMLFFNVVECVKTKVTGNIKEKPHMVGKPVINI